MRRVRAILLATRIASSYLGSKLGFVGYFRSPPNRGDGAGEHEPRFASDLATYVQQRPGTCIVGRHVQRKKKHAEATYIPIVEVADARADATCI